MPARRIASLAGVQVVVTRAEGSDGSLTRCLAERGARVLHWPVLRFAPPEDEAPLRVALDRLLTYDGVVFTSPRAVAAVCGRVRQPVGTPWVAAVGEATRQALEAAGWRVDRISSEARSAALAEDLLALGTEGGRVLFPASSIARDELPHRLRQGGVEVDRVTAYRTVVNDSLDPESCLAELDEASVSILTFASPSAVVGLESVLSRPVFAALCERCPVVAIGPTTAAALERCGVRATVTAARSTLADLADAAEKAVPRKEV